MAVDFTQFKPRPRPPTLLGREACPLPPVPTRILEALRAAFAEPFIGVTTHGIPVPGLFRLERTGISTSALVDTATAFLASLDAQQTHAVTFDITSGAWRSWSNISPFLIRHGLLLESLSPAQRDKGLALLRASLSDAGMATASDVMKLNHTIAEMTGRWQEYGQWVYWISLFGTPSDHEPWGWQLDGHHLNLHCLVVGDQIVMTPMFMGSEPTYASAGTHAGTRVFEVEEALGLQVMRQLGVDQQDAARIGMQLPNDVLTTAARDNAQLAYAGLAWDGMDSEQRRQLLRLIDVYVSRMRPDHARIRMEEVTRHLSQTHFAWIGASDDSSPFYYRVHSPVILIEFDHQPGLALDNDFPSRNHTHTVVRTPNGNDYGKDLLRQHYAQFHQASSAH
jgi:hypothetical protein